MDSLDADVHEICKLIAAGKTHVYLDRLLALLSDPQDVGDFARCDAALAALTAKVAYLPASGWICALGITFRAWREGRLPSRAAFCQAVRAEMSTCTLGATTKTSLDAFLTEAACQSEKS